MHWGISTFKSEATVISQNWATCLSGGVWVILLNLRVLFLNEGIPEQEVDRCNEGRLRSCQFAGWAIFGSKEPVEVIWVSDMGSSWVKCYGQVPPEVEDKLWGTPRTCWRDYISQLAWEHLCSPDKPKEADGDKVVWASLVRLLFPWRSFR